jgi:hypothetical protein
LGIENRKPKIEKKFSLSKAATTTKNNLNFFLKNLKKLFLFFWVRADSRGEGGGGRGGRGGRERGGDGSASTRTPMSAQTLGCVCTEAKMRPRGHMCVRADASAFTRTLVFYPLVTSKRTLQCVHVTDAPAAIVRSSVRPSVQKRPRDNHDIGVNVTSLGGL